MQTNSEILDTGHTSLTPGQIWMILGYYDIDVADSCLCIGSNICYKPHHAGRRIAKYNLGIPRVTSGFRIGPLLSMTGSDI